MFSSYDGIYFTEKEGCYFILSGKVYKIIRNKKDVDDLIIELNQIAKAFDHSETIASRIYSFIDELNQLEFS